MLELSLAQQQKSLSRREQEREVYSFAIGARRCFSFLLTTESAASPASLILSPCGLCPGAMGAKSGGWPYAIDAASMSIALEGADVGQKSTIG